MDNEYFTWDDFVESFDQEMEIAADIYENMVKGGLKANCLCRFDYHQSQECRCVLFTGDREV